MESSEEIRKQQLEAYRKRKAEERLLENQKKARIAEKQHERNANLKRR